MIGKTLSHYKVIEKIGQREAWVRFTVLRTPT